MIGIAGIFLRDGAAVDRADEERLAQAIAHGTPRDLPRFRDVGVFLCGGGCALEPPAVLFCGRLDNASEMRADLTGAALPFPKDRIAGDAECVRRAAACWGDDAAERLLGDFAYAVWDARERRLVAARDALGVVPFYYYLTGNRFAFASEIGALLALPWIPRDPDELRIADYVAVQFEDQESTFYRAIRRLPPAHTLVVSPSVARSRRYWVLDPEKEIVPASDGEAAERFRAVFLDAVRGRLQAAPRPALLLSGGLDSASILYAAQSIDPGSAPLATFSAVFPDQRHADEMRELDAMLGEVRASPCFVRADMLSPLGASHEMMGQLRQPYHAPNLFIYWVLVQAAQAAGVRTLLDGVDGDTTVSHGLEFLHQLFRSLKWRAWVRETRALARRLHAPTLNLLWRFGVRPAVSHNSLGRLVGGGGHAAGMRPALLDPDFARRVDWSARRTEAIAAARAPAPTLRAAHHRQLTNGLIPFYLEVNHALAAPLGIDARHPYYDRRLVELCLALPPALHLQDGWDRRVQRLAMEGLVPARVHRRLRKAYWGRNFEHSFLNHDRKRLEETLAAARQQLGQFLDLRRLDAALLSTGRGGKIEADVMDLWVAATLGIWLVSAG